MTDMTTASQASPARYAAITGAAEGLGREVAIQLAQKGYHVFGTALSTAETAALRGVGEGRISLSVCDITDSDDVARWAADVQSVLGDHGLDLLISNAGILTPGPLEALELDAIRREFEVNVFGALSVINAFLPMLRDARGRIVQVSTWTATVPMPFNGPSGASKAAIEVLSTVYRAELEKFGVEVVIAAPGNMRTGGPAKTARALAAAAEAMAPDQRALYADAFATFAEGLNAMQSTGIEADEAARLLIEIAEQKPAPARAPIGPDAAEMLHAAKTLSDSELDELRLKLVGLKN